MNTELQRHLYEQLAALASQGQTISYRKLAEIADIPGPQVIRKLTSLLENIIRDDHAKGINASLAVLVVSQTTPAIPRPGYFMLLRELGSYDGPSDGDRAADFHAQQLQLVFARYRTGSNRT